LLNKIENLEKPVIAAVNGNALEARLIEKCF
jgi:enoyl-CoA hydratase/carnithine racemase